MRRLCEKYKSLLNSEHHIDATGKVVTPGLIDPHTHLVHAGTRENEYAMRLQGKTYMEIMEAGGGIHATTRATQEASHEELYDQSRKRLDQFLITWRDNGRSKKWLWTYFGTRNETTRSSTAAIEGSPD